MKVNKIIIVLSLALTGSLLLSSGCGMMEKVFIDDLMPKRAVKNKPHAAKKEQVNSEILNNANKQENQGSENKTVEKGNNPSANNKASQINITIFLADKEDLKLVPVQRKIEKVEGLAKAAVNELLKGPGKNEKFYSVIPTGTRILDIVIKNGICYINFSKELQKNHPGGSNGEALTVNAIVKTLCQFSTIEKVQILIEGNVVESLAGHMDISKPLTP